MEINKRIDKSKLRKESEEKKIPILELLFKKLAKDKVTNSTLFAVCPNSETVLRAAIRAAKRANAPILFAATLNQVDIDGGYTGWTPEDLIRKIKEESYRIDYKGPTIVGIDHGGPWLKDRQTIEKWDLDRSICWIKKSFEAAILAGYDLIHVDPTVDIYNTIKIDTVAKRTIELIYHIETYRKAKGLNPISYEVGTEEVHGGLVDINVFKRFLGLLRDGLARKGLKNLWPIFIVAKVGTDLHTSNFNLEVAKEVVSIASNYGSYIKGHYTDFVNNLEEYVKSGVGGANVGPEFTILEFEALTELSQIEEALFKKNKVSIKSNIIKILEKAVFDSGRWKKWLIDSEKNFDSLKKDRKEWIVKTSSRYVWANPEVKNSRNELYTNLKMNGIDGENIVLTNIEKGMDKYFRNFNLLDLNTKLKN
jgi:tagatose-1,6-bisphosphate aldolase non-catalytic subunit AgaZ/GatZ